MKKIIPYLILNFLVSAAAILIVLLIWNAIHKTPDVIIPSASLQPTDVVSPILPSAALPLDAQTLQVQIVVGAGDINLERVQMVSVAEEAVNLQGWRIMDEQHNEFIFPLLTIYPEGGLNLYTRSGVNTSVEVFWGLEKTVWDSGETVTLLDADGNLRSSYLIP